MSGTKKTADLEDALLKNAAQKVQHHQPSEKISLGSLSRLTEQQSYKAQEVQLVCKHLTAKKLPFVICDGDYEPLKSLAYPKVHSGVFIVAQEDHWWKVYYLYQENEKWIVETSKSKQLAKVIRVLQEHLKHLEVVYPPDFAIADREEDSGPLALHNLELIFARLHPQISVKPTASVPNTGVNVNVVRTHLRVIVTKELLEQELSHAPHITKEQAGRIQRNMEMILKVTEKTAKPFNTYIDKLKALSERFGDNEDLNLTDKETKDIKEAQSNLMKAVVDSDTSSFKSDYSLTQQPNQNGKKEGNMTIEDRFAEILKLVKGMERTSESCKFVEAISNKFGLHHQLLDKLVFNPSYITPASLKSRPQNNQVDFVAAVNAIPTVPPIAQQKDSASFMNELIEEIVKLSNSSKPKDLVEQYRGDLLKTYEFVSTWSKRSKLDILKWSTEVKQFALKPSQRLELLAVMNRANQLITSYPLRVTQMLAYLCFLQSQPNYGKIVQINTGEGKTIIISLLAVLKALELHQVDIITSNEVLAAQGVAQRVDFYKLFGLTTATNNADATNQNKPRACYNCNIVYGSITNFQFDYLNDVFEGMGTRSNRTFGWVLLDEVDSIVVDNGGNIAKMAENFPGMDYLRYIYIKMWIELDKAEKRVLTENEGELQKLAKQLEKNSKTLKPTEKQQKYEEKRRQLEKDASIRIEKIVLESRPDSIHLIPVHLRSFAQRMLPRWFSSAVNAKHNYKEKQQYVLKTTKQGNEQSKELSVVPVDYLNTGVTLNNTIWCDGLHQFIQLKHNLQLTPQNLTTSFISNVGYIRLYGNKVFGMTGTLGSKAEQQVMSEVYKVEYGRIPPYKPKRVIREQDIKVKDGFWTSAVVTKAFAVIESHRSILIICKTIKELEQIAMRIEAEALSSKTKPKRIRKYINESNCDVVKDSVDIEEIIIATNISGRGTDFKTTAQLQRHGGLHVSLTFLPCNKRVEDQALGRTGRQGNNGSGQLLIKQSDLEEIQITSFADLSFEKVYQCRDGLESLRLKAIKEKKLPDIVFKDELFKEFTQLYKSFSQKPKKSTIETLENIHVKKDLKERWAFWLHEKDQLMTEKGSNCTVKDCFAEFKALSKGAVDKNEISFNFFNMVNLAESLLCEVKVPEARDALMNAQRMCKDTKGHLFPIYTKLFEVEIEQGGQLMERFKKAVKEVFFLQAHNKNQDYKKKAEQWLIKAARDLEVNIKYISDELMIGSEGKPGQLKQLLTRPNPNWLYNHFESQMAIYDLFKKHIESQLQRIRKSSSEEGISIAQRIPNYFKTVQPPENDEDMRAIKKRTSDTEFEQIGRIGMSVVYSLREVHDASKEVITGAKIWIGSGIIVLGAGICFPPAIPFTGPFGGSLISEGMTDIAMQLLSQGNSQFEWGPYIKSKMISLAMSICTMGITAIKSSVTIMNKAIAMCRRISAWLRRCQHLQWVCQALATGFDKIAAYLVKVRDLAAFAKLPQARQLESLNLLAMSGNVDSFGKYGGMSAVNRLQQLQQAGILDTVCRKALIKEAVMDVCKSTCESLASALAEHFLEHAVDWVLDKIRPQILQIVRDKIIVLLSAKDLEWVDWKEFEKKFQEVMGPVFWEKLTQKCRSIAVKISKIAESWKLKILVITLDSLACFGSVVTLLNECKPFLKSLSRSKTKNQAQEIKEMQEYASRFITDRITGMVSTMANKYLNSYVADPILDAFFNPDETDEEIRNYGERLLLAENNALPVDLIPAVPPAVRPAAQPANHAA